VESFKELFKGDLKRYKKGEVRGFTYKFLFYFRKASTCDNKILSLYYRYRYRKVCEKHGIEISRRTSIKKGLYLGHPYNITINENAKLGKNINIHKGVTIGMENRGMRYGAPIIKDRVWIGINSTIVGKVTIGEDVLIAPNSYVNCDVPNHSIVIGNPCKIIKKENATKSYINNIV